MRNLVPLKIGEPANNALLMNAWWNKIWFDHQENSTELSRFARMWHKDAVVITGNSLSKLTGLEPSGRYPYGSAWRQNPPGNANLFENYFTLDAGVYDFVVLGVSSSDAGLVRWGVDGVQIGTTDFYAASTNSLTRLVINGVTVSTSGIHTLTGLLTKNPSSTSFYAQLYKYCFRESAS